jgi:hypothetical protein
MTRNSFSPEGTFHRSTAFATLLRSMRFRLPVRAVVVAAAMMAAAPADAEEPRQDWLPDDLAMPEDAELVTERAIGSSIRLFTISTAEDVDTHFAAWEESLRENGYEIIQGEDEVLARSIEFSGGGISNAKIILSPTTNEDRRLIEFDATLD